MLLVPFDDGHIKVSYNARELAVNIVRVEDIFYHLLEIEIINLEMLI